MYCRKCKKEILENSKFCNYCGTKQEYERSAKKRGNGQGTVYKDKNGKWIAEYTIGWDEANGTLLRKKRKKRGFATKGEAIAYIPNLKQEVSQQDMNVKFKDLYKKWMDRHAEKVTTSTINCYKSAYKYFKTLYYVEVAKIRTEHMQKCIDECPHGKRTKENMKALGTSLCRYAMELDIVDRNYAEYIYIAKGEKTEKTAFSNEQIQMMWDNVTNIPGLKYVLVLCYTGMRLGEMLCAKTENYNKEERYFITGLKTDAGKDRIITISPRILPFFEDFGKGEYLFFDDGEKPSEKKFRKDTFYPALQQLGIDILKADGSHLYTPHCCRHSFATMMKNVNAPATDKQKLIGHSKFEMTAYYTHTDIESLKAITDNI
ncbi:MAG: zinc-ribbon domain-containing protein [Ruminococcaceae bacterium]|nr:zinc-ribbon domain-containing protein [Oscillospiraceae bacterium]